ncbi:hypothetical protein M3193_07875 [Sporosarcina luteola]|uniref:hypothetical protein n=1 Tax=Sporosarcina luteola TaxID=582850 RepID=UPI00204237D2|nr:hypothetical protein [Sporosarcina luteola]MCM3744059.1 hypothetical protein [Sporosarcina luteola]
MKMTPLKKKIMAGTISVGLLSGVGMAFANKDVGGALKSWYDGVFDGAVGSMESQLGGYAAGKLPGLQNEYNGMKTDAEGSINSTRNYEINRASTAINTASQGYIGAVNTAKGQIMAGMGQDFHKIYTDAITELNRLGGVAQEYAKNDLEAFTGNKGQLALDKVQTDLDAAKTRAVSALDTAISNAKAAITTEINTQADTEVKTLKADIDKKIEELRGQITQIKNDLVEEQAELIRDKADELEQDAKEALDALVDGI